MSAPVASRPARFWLVATRPADGSRPLVGPSRVNRPEASGAAPPPWPQCPPHSRGSRPVLTAADGGPSSNAPSKRLPLRGRQAYNPSGEGVRFRSTACLCRLRATKTLFR
jgi:hypothetical protein